MVCAQLTDAARNEFVQTTGIVDDLSCEAAVGAFSDTLTSEEADALARTDVRRVQVDGDTASVRDTDVIVEKPWEVANVDQQPLRLRRIDGKWLIEDLG